MQYCDCDVEIGGEITQTARLRYVPAPEVPILRQVHGATSVKNFSFSDFGCFKGNGGFGEDFVGPDKTFGLYKKKPTNEEVLEYLSRKYSPKHIDAVYPGAQQLNLPSKFSEVGVNIGGNEAEAPEEEDAA